MYKIFRPPQNTFNWQAEGMSIIHAHTLFTYTIGYFWIIADKTRLALQVVAVKVDQRL